MAATGKTALKAFFNTGDQPTESQFADFIESYENLVDDNLLIGASGGLSGVYPSDQSTATALTLKLNYLSQNVSGRSGFVLPVALKGRMLYAWVAVNQKVDIYPASGESFSTFDLDAPLHFTGQTLVMFVCPQDGIWLWFIQNTADLSLTSGEFILNVTQAGTADPTTSVIVNTIGSFNIGRLSAGSYQIQFNDFTYDLTKAAIIINQSEANAKFTCGALDDSTLYIISTNNSNVLTDALLNNTTISIKLGSITF